MTVVASDGSRHREQHTSRTSQRRSPATVRRSAAKRRARYVARIAQASGAPFRRRLWALWGWLAAEGHHASQGDQDWLLRELEAIAEKLNQEGRS